MAAQCRASHPAHDHSVRGMAGRTLPGLPSKRCGLLGPILLAWANCQSGPVGLQSSGLRPTAPGTGERALPRGHHVQCSGVVPTGSPMAEVEKCRPGKHRRGVVDVLRKEPRVGAHRGGGAMVGWWREFGAMTVGGGGSLEGGRRCPEALLWLGKSEGEVRDEPDWRKGEEGVRWWLSPQRGDGVGGMDEFLVRGDAPTVGAVGKATVRGVCPWGALEGGWRGKEPRRGGVGDTLLKWRRGEAREGWGAGVG
jgi:hypothetical protein